MVVIAKSSMTQDATTMNRTIHQNKSLPKRWNKACLASYILTSWYAISNKMFHKNLQKLVYAWILRVMRLQLEKMTYHPPTEHTKLTTAITDLLCISKTLPHCISGYNLCSTLSKEETYCSFVETNTTTAVNMTCPNGNKSLYLRKYPPSNSPKVT